MPAGQDRFGSPITDPDPAPLLEVQNLTVVYPSSRGPLTAVRDLSFQIKRGEILALVGETGCGKSTVALALLGLAGAARRAGPGRILFDGTDLTLLEGKGWRKIRGGGIGMIFQDSRSALNPVLTIGDQLLETMRIHQRLTAAEARRRALQILGSVGIADGPLCMRSYSHELSGGMCQRVAVALAVCNRPQLLVADEPTSALDPTLQAQVLGLIHRMSREAGLALLLISHDLALVASYADRVAVMYHGRLVESGPAREIFARPAHPYTRGLLESQPTMEHLRDTRPLISIDGAPPEAGREMPGCAFAPRCLMAEPACAIDIPAPAALSRNHWAACVKARD